MLSGMPMVLTTSVVSWSGVARRLNCWLRLYSAAHEARLRAVAVHAVMAWQVSRFYGRVDGRREPTHRVTLDRYLAWAANAEIARLGKRLFRATMWSSRVMGVAGHAEEALVHRRRGRGGDGCRIQRQCVFVGALLG